MLLCNFFSKRKFVSFLKEPILKVGLTSTQALQSKGGCHLRIDHAAKINDIAFHHYDIGLAIIWRAYQMAIITFYRKLLVYNL